MNQFTLTDDEILTLREWDRAGHDCTITTEGAIGDRLTYQFTPTGLGIIKVVKCACGAKLNLTNYEDW
jgi:hypothetical protein